jgi:Tfp pilus assembly protein PilN
MSENTAANQEVVSWENGDSPEALAASPDQVAVVWLGSEVVVASPAASDDSGSFDLDLTRLPADFNLAAAINVRRDNLGVPRISENTAFLTVAPNSSERTKVLSLDQETLELDDEQLVEWLIDAERQVTPGTDAHPIFESTLEETACSVARLPNRSVAMTEVPRQHIESVRGRVFELSGGADPDALRLWIETPVRGALRYFLTALPEGVEAMAPGKESEVLALVIIGRAGFSFGLWNQGAGLFTEYGFPAPAELNAKPGEWEAILKGFVGGEEVPQQRNQLLEEFDFYVRQAFDQLLLQLSPETAGELGMSSFSKVVWATENGLDVLIAPIAEEYANYASIEFFKLQVPADEAVASGLLLGSFNFGFDSVAGVANLAQVNLGRDLLYLADQEEMERRRLEDMMVQQKRNRMVLTVAAPVVLLLAVLLGVVLDTVRSTLMLTYRESQADARAAELKPALDRRRSYERTLKWYEEFIAQVSALRKQQPVSIGMLYDLNSSYPLGIDPNFYVAEMKLTPKGDVELKGFSQNKDAVTTFLRALEFTGGEESGNKLFTNLAYEVREGVAQDGKSPNMGGSAMKGGNTAPGVVEWVIKGVYTPVEAIAPKEAPKGRRPGAAAAAKPPPPPSK